MGMIPKTNEKNKAIQYRKNGISVNEIARMLNVSTGSVSSWVKDIELTQEQKNQLLKNTREGSSRAHRTEEFKKKCKNRWAGWRLSPDALENKFKQAMHKAKYQKDRRLALKIYLVNLRGGKCEKCGYCKNLAALGFHHKDPSKKEFRISRTLWKREKILKELEKCDLLCHNCHAEEHHPDQNI